MPFVVGGLAALVALAAGILAHVDPLTTLWRAALALVLGWVGANVWSVITSTGKMPEQESVEAIASPADVETS